MSDRLLTVPEVAEYLRLTPASIYTQRARGELPGALGVKVGKRVVFRPEDIEAYLDARVAERVGGAK